LRRNPGAAERRRHRDALAEANRVFGRAEGSARPSDYAIILIVLLALVVIVAITSR